MMTVPSPTGYFNFEHYVLFQTSSAQKEYINLGANFTENVQGYNTRHKVDVPHLCCTLKIIIKAPCYRSYSLDRPNRQSI